MFKEGVPICISKDVQIQRFMNCENIADALGIKSDSQDCIAYRIANYIVEEASKVINYRVRKIFIAGGTIETNFLFDFIEQKVNEFNPLINVCTFERESNGVGQYEIGDAEDSAYASAMGGNYICLNDIEIQLALSLTYGSWCIGPFSRAKVFAAFEGAIKGAPLNKEGETTFATIFNASARVVGEEMFSVALTAKDIETEYDSKHLNYLDDSLAIGEQNSSYRENATKYAGLKTVAGGKNAKITMKVQGRIIESTNGVRIHFLEGIVVDSEGHATPFIRNYENNNERVEAYMRGGDCIRVRKKDITFQFEGVNDFTVAGAGD